MKRDDFFVGYISRLPRSMRLAIPLAMLGLLAGFAGGALAISLTQAQPDPSAIRWSNRESQQEVKAAGVLVARPYPHVRVAPTAEKPNGETVLMVRAGKAGVGPEAVELDGRTVEARGDWTTRGELRMLQLRGPKNLVAVDEPAAATARAAPDGWVREDLGRWRIAGEICDGKCYLGAMRPGVGLAHKACANFCLISGAPPVFVTEREVEGTTFMMIAAADGGPLPDKEMRDLTALFIEAEGRLERWGDLLMFKVDLATVRRL